MESGDKRIEECLIEKRKREIEQMEAEERRICKRIEEQQEKEKEERIVDYLAKGKYVEAACEGLEYIPLSYARLVSDALMEGAKAESVYTKKADYYRMASELYLLIDCRTEFENAFERYHSCEHTAHCIEMANDWSK